MRTACAAAIGMLTLLMLAPAAGASPRQSILESFDATPIRANFFPAPGLEAGERAPTVMVGHGWGAHGERNPEGGSSVDWGTTGVGPTRRAGYNVLTWDARGFGESGGTARLNSPYYEGRDVKMLIDFVAEQPEALLDGPGNPRMGMSGASYGGGIQLVAAAIDPRIDAIVPTLAYNSFVTSFMPDRAYKLGWGTVLVGLGTAGVLEGLVSPSGMRAAHLDPAIRDSYVRAATTGDPGEENVRWFRERGPGGAVRRIRAATFLIQGKVDSVITASEAIRNHELLQAGGAPVKMLWFCGGHGECRTVRELGNRIERATIAWFDRHLKRDPSVETGPAFEWVDEEGTWRSGPGYPLASAGWLRGRGKGRLTVSPTPSGSGSPWAAEPAALESVNVPIESSALAASIVGEPRVRLSYSGQAVPQRTWVFAQIVDERRGVVVDNQATPLPVTLDGRLRSVERALAGIATRALPSSPYRLQLVTDAPVYNLQRSHGLVDLQDIVVSLPLVDASRTGGIAGAGREAPTCHPSMRSPARRWPARGRLALVVVRLRLPCTGQMLPRRVLIRSGGRAHLTTTGRATPIRIGRGQRHAWARFIYRGRLRSRAIRLGPRRPPARRGHRR